MSPNKKPEKGFIKELGKKPVAKPQKTRFLWEDAVVNPGKVEGMKTKHRIEHKREVKTKQVFVVDAKVAIEGKKK